MLTVLRANSLAQSASHQRHGVAVCNGWASSVRLPAEEQLTVAESEGGGQGLTGASAADVAAARPCQRRQTAAARDAGPAGVAGLVSTAHLAEGSAHGLWLHLCGGLCGGADVVGAAGEAAAADAAAGETACAGAPSLVSSNHHLA